VSHDALRLLISGYAAGELDDARAAAVRAHLASGCAECLAAMFGRPVGLPRRRPEPAPPSPAPATRRIVVGTALLATAAAVALAVLAARAVVELRRREATVREDAERAALQAADDHAALEARVRRLESELEGARAEASAQADAARSARAENLRLEDALRAADERPEAPAPAPLPRVARRDGDPPPPAATGVRVVPLHAVSPFHDPRGHVVWNPRADELTLYAFDLPPLPDGAGYRVLLHLEDGRVESGPVLEPGRDGAASRVVPVGGDGARLDTIDVVLEPSARPVLVGRVSDAGS